MQYSHNPAKILSVLDSQNQKILAAHCINLPRGLGESGGKNPGADLRLPLLAGSLCSYAFLHCNRLDLAVMQLGIKVLSAAGYELINRFFSEG